MRTVCLSSWGPNDAGPRMNPLVRRIATVAWPAFVGAGLIEMLVFAHVDPGALHALDGAALALSSTAVYSLAFLAFWALVGASCWVALRLAQGADDADRAACADDAGRAESAESAESAEPTTR